MTKNEANEANGATAGTRTSGDLGAAAGATKDGIEARAPERSEYKGHPILVLNPGARFPFQFGLTKARLILGNVEAIRKFLEDEETKAIGADLEGGPSFHPHNEDRDAENALESGGLKGSDADEALRRGER